MMHQTHLTITTYSHYFSCTELSPTGRGMCNGFAAQFVSYKMENIPGTGRQQRVKDKVYAAADASRLYFHFHINLLDKFLEYLTERHMTDNLIKRVVAPKPKAVDIELLMQTKYTPKDDQVDHIDYLVNSEHPSCLLTRQTGTGKAQPLDAKIKVPGGWKTMGEMSVGQEVIAPDGTVTQVTGVYPQGAKTIYRITFQDGRTARCCGEHLWKVHQPSRGGGYWRVINTKEMIRVMGLSVNRLYVPTIESEQSSDSQFPIDPYLLGVLLGDGHIGQDVLILSAPDPEIVERVKALLPAGVMLRLRAEGGYDYNAIRTDKTQRLNPLLEQFKTWGLRAKLSDAKFVPEEYLHGSTSQRLALLQGLLDTDGTAAADGGVSFCSTSLILATQVQYLVRSLGGKASLSNKQTHYTYKEGKKFGKPSFVVQISYPRPNELFTLPRKRDRLGETNQYSEHFKLRVVKVEPIGEDLAQCISVAHPDKLYVTNGFVVTHNTFCAMAGASRLGKRVGIVIKAMYVKKWEADVKELCQLRDKDVLIVGGGSSLKQLQLMAKEGTIDAKIIIFSLDGIQNWYKEFEEHGMSTMDMGYECTPWDLFEFCGIGTVIRDEVHQRFHQLFKMDMYLNVQRSISLSATLIHHDPLINKLYEVMFPTRWRGKDLGLTKYIDAYAVHYYFKNPDKIRTKEYGNKNYAHTAVEKSILKHVPTMLEYFRFIHEVMKSSYFQHPRKTKKLAVYASSVEMCSRLTEYFKTKYPDLDIRRYCAGENDPYENVIDADIRFSTVGSSGTAIDIPNLTTVILTIALSSIQANIQVLGRLRELKGGETPAENQPAFYYLTADNIEKHVFYHNAKKEMLEQRARTFNDIYSGFNV